MRRVLALAPFSCAKVPSDFPPSPFKTLCPYSPALPAFLGGCAGSGAGSGLGRKHSSCLTGGSEKLPWKVKSGQHPPPYPNHFPTPCPVSLGSWGGRGGDGGGRAQLVPGQAGSCVQGTCQQGRRRGTLSSSGPCCNPRTTMAETPETRGMGIPCRPLSMHWQWVCFISFLQPHFLSSSTLHAGKMDDTPPALYTRTAKRAQRRLQIPPRQAGWAGGERAPPRWRSGRQDAWKMPRTP